MKKGLFIIFFLLGCTCCFSQSLQALQSKRIKLPNGWSITPAGRSLPLGDLPLNIIISPSKKYAAVTNNGNGEQSIELIDVKQEKVLDRMVIPKSWYGLKFSSNEKFLYASGGNDNWILKYAIKPGPSVKIPAKLVLEDSIKLGDKWPVKISPTGIEIDDAAKKMYVVTKENSSLYIINLLTKEIINKLTLPGEGFACLLSTGKKELFISCWGCDKVLVYNVASGLISDEIPVGDNPNELCLTRAGKYLFVTNANDNSVSVIDTKKRKVIETLDAALFPGAPPGSTSNGLALSADEKTLFVANADNNCVALFDISWPGNSKGKGFIPTGWFPTSLKVVGNKILVTNGKGFSSAPNPYGPNPVRTREQVLYQEGDKSKPVKVQFIGSLLQGTLSIIDIPSEKQLGIYSRLVYENSPFKNKDMGDRSPGNPVPVKPGDPSPIKYVFYVIKENRTYDQVLGDMKEGNGDSSLAIFGEKFTPNLHKLAREFVLLDNFYCDGEVSADGHSWSLGAYATDFLEKTWPSQYSSRGGTYSGEGMRQVANNKSYIWDQCQKKGISYRTYGEFAENGKGSLKVLDGHVAPKYTGWNMGVRDTTRFFQWKHEFDSLILINAVPRFNSLRMGNDHTEGLRKDKPTPFAHVADNDYAVGMFIEYLSKSSIWDETAVFVVEDDAQNGSDHVDAHRSTAYVAGGFVKRNFVDHTMYSTSSMLRTMELILGLQPMTQYDAGAEPLWRCFSDKIDRNPFLSLPCAVDLDQKNIVMNEWQRRSELFDFTHEDAIPDMEFNIVLWYGIKGDHVPMPAPRRAAFVKPVKEKEGDDD